MKQRILLSVSYFTSKTIYRLAYTRLKSDLIDVHQDADIDDQYYIDYDPNGTWQHYNEGDMGSEYGGSEMYDDPGSVAPSQMEDWGEGGTDWGTEMGDEGEGDYERGEEDYGDDGTLDQCAFQTVYTQIAD